MFKARNAEYSVPMKYGKVLFCGAAAAGKSNFLNLLMDEEFQLLHISTEVLKPQQVTIAFKAKISNVEIKKMNIDDEILQLWSYLPEKYPTTASNSLNSDKKANKNFKKGSQDKANGPENTTVKSKSNFNDTNTENSTLVLAKVDPKANTLPKKPEKEVCNFLTFIDTGGQPQLISMLPAVNSFAMITFIIHNMEGGQKRLNEVAKVQYGNEKGEASITPHPHKYSNLQLIETLMSYTSSILFPGTEFLDDLKDKDKSKKNGQKKLTRSILLVGTHSGGDTLSIDDIEGIDKELMKVIEQSCIDHIRPRLNNNYSYLVPVDNKMQSKYTTLTYTTTDEKRFTKPSMIRSYIKKMLDNQDKIFVPIKWLLLELEIRKVCQEKKCYFISYNDVLKLAEQKKFGYSGEFGENDTFNDDSVQFIEQGLRFHHSFGVLLYFEEVKGMKELVIINHQWLFNKLTEIVCYSFSHNFDRKSHKDDFEETGIFAEEILDSNHLNIHKDFEDSGINTENINPKESFLNLLQHLRIAAKHADGYFMPFVLKSCNLINLERIIPKYNANIQPLLIQYKSNDNKVYFFPRGAFCFLVVELMTTEKWEPCGQAYVNLLTLVKMELDNVHYITLIDRIFCLEVHITHFYEKQSIIQSICKIIRIALYAVAKQIKMDVDLCYGFSCSCSRIENMHISYITQNKNFGSCHKNGKTELGHLHKVWFGEVRAYIAM